MYKTLKPALEKELAEIKDAGLYKKNALLLLHKEQILKSVLAKK